MYKKLNTNNHDSIGSLRKRMVLVLAIFFVMSVLTVGIGQIVASGFFDNSYSKKNNSFTSEVTTSTNNGVQYYGDMDSVAANYASEYIVTRHKPMGGSHYAYTEGITDDIIGGSPKGNEGNFFPGSQLVKLTVTGSGENSTSEDVLIDSKTGVIRDPDVSADGTLVVFSWKQDKLKDDFHLYIYDLAVGDFKQITFGQGISDIEPKFLPNNKIVFSSTRAVQTVDCWKTPVSNLYLCNTDGSGIIRVGYDQVHTTYPTVTDDGRVLYTRWDYNDRTQMYVHGVFQMAQDGTNQTELFGNGANGPTSQLHTIQVPGNNSKYLTIVSGHHTSQGGKLAMVDLGEGRNSKDAFTYINYPAAYNSDGSKNLNNDIWKDGIDTMGQDGNIFKFPYAINEYEMFYAKAASWSGDHGNKANTAKFDLYYYNTKTGKEEKIISANTNSKISFSQIVPIRNRKVFNRPSMVNYGIDTGTYYIGNIYSGEGLKGVAKGDAKYLRVVALDYRAYSVGSVFAGNSKYYTDGQGTADPHTPVGVANATWDIKQVLGIVPIESDGSVLFKVPADLPIYFQVLDADGLLIQSMRSWSTVMPNETFSCVGCHENKNSAPPLSGTTTIAMRKGVQLLQKDLWMTGAEYKDYDPYKDYKGFSYDKEIQPILDSSCIDCHDNQTAAKNYINKDGTDYNKIDSGFSLKGDGDNKIKGVREKINYNLSYLVLVGAKYTDRDNNGDFFYTGRPNNRMTNWIGAMNQAQVQDPYQNGSKKSNIIDLLMNDTDGNHSGLSITKSQIQALAAWIDLGVPFRGTYDEANTWNSNDYREYEERTNMRNFYNKLDRINKDIYAGKGNDKKINIEHYRNGDLIKSTTEANTVHLYGDNYYKTGDKFVVNLPAGEKYFYFNLDPKIKESLIYVPSGTFEYEIPKEATQIFPRTLISTSNDFKGYMMTTTTARLPSENELKATYNLAQNSYDVYENGERDVFPKATASATHTGDWGNYLPSNAIDGFTNTLGHGSYPVQSWGPPQNQGNKLWYNVDFGREVNVSSLTVFVRSDWGGEHDSYITTMDVELSDGTIVSAELEKSSAGQIIKFDRPYKTTSIKIKNIVTQGKADAWFALTELQVFGTNV